MSDFIIKDINKSFDGIKAVNEFSFKWGNYKIVGLIGPNGAGKTTLFNIITGFIPSNTGQFLFKSKNILNLPPHKVVSRGISRTFQDLRLLHQVPVMENVLLWRLNQAGENPFQAWLRGKNFNEDRVQNIAETKSILNFVGLYNKRHDLAETLSYGQQKLLSLACALATEADYLLLDEPVAGVNPQMIDKILKLLQKLAAKGKHIMLIEHNIEAVRSVCDWLVVMDQGQNIAAGYPGEVLQKEEIIEAYLD